MISYYELLGMIKENNIPEKVIYDDNTYIWNGRIYRAIEADNYSYLSRDIDEIDMIKRNIKIVEDKKIEKLKIEDFNSVRINDEERVYCELPPDEVKLINKINEIIEVLNEKEKIQNNKK